MIMLIHGIVFTVCTVLAAASWDGNINYGSPSLRHASLGLDTLKVKKRMLQKRDGSYHHTKDVKFTHGVASVSSEQAKMQARTLNLKGRPFR